MFEFHFAVGLSHCADKRAALLVAATPLRKRIFIDVCSRVINLVAHWGEKKKDCCTVKLHLLCGSQQWPPQLDQRCRTWVKAT